MQKPKHAGGKDDIQAIGNRKIGERGLGNWYPLESEIGIGREYSQAVESSVIPLVFVGGGVGPGHKVIASTLLLILNRCEYRQGESARVSATAS